jgi:twitching motility protein PilI
MLDTSDPFDLLLDIEQRCQANAAGLPTLDKVEEEWVGVGFRIGDDKLIAHMNEIEEILDLPEFTNVPGVKSWMVGVANVRGGLLPLMDLNGFILGQDIKQRKKESL